MTGWHHFRLDFHADCVTQEPTSVLYGRLEVIEFILGQGDPLRVDFANIWSILVLLKKPKVAESSVLVSPQEHLKSIRVEVFWAETHRAGVIARHKEPIIAGLRRLKVTGEDVSGAWIPLSLVS